MVLALDEVGVAGVVMHDEAPLVVAAVVLEARRLGVSVAVVPDVAVLVLDGVVLGDAVLVLVLGEVVPDVAVLVLVLGEEGELVVVMHDGDPAVVAAVVLALGDAVLDGVVLVLTLGDAVLAAGELDVLPVAELPAAPAGETEGDTAEVVMEDGVEGAPNALAVGMSTSVSDAADTPSSRCVPVRACDMFVLHCPDFTARRAVAHVCRRKDGAQTCADCQVKTSTHG